MAAYIQFQFSVVHMHLKTNNVDYLKKPSRNFFLCFAIHSSSTHENRCRMSVRFFAYFNALETNGVRICLFSVDKI